MNQYVCVCSIFMAFSYSTPPFFMYFGIAMQCRQYISLLIVQFVCRLTTTGQASRAFFFFFLWTILPYVHNCYVLLGYITFLILPSYYLQGLSKPPVFNVSHHISAKDCLAPYNPSLSLFTKRAGMNRVCQRKQDSFVSFRKVTIFDLGDGERLFF